MPDLPGENAQPKIIIDSDWKAQAQKERERLAAKEREEAAKKSRSGAPAGVGSRGPGAGAPGATTTGDSKRGAVDGQGEEPGMPQADFPALVGTLATQALMYLGAFPDPQTGRAIVSLEYARFHIDLLAILEEKTRGNLPPPEADDLKQALNELRLRFVEIAKAVEKASKEGRLKPGAAGGVVGAGGGMAMGAAGGLGSGIAGPGL